MELNTTLTLIIAVALVYVAFRAGQEFEREEAAPRRAKKADELAQLDGALNYLCLAAVAVGKDTPEFHSAVTYVDQVAPHTKERLQFLTEKEIEDRALMAVQRMKSPEYKHSNERVRAYSDSLRESIKRSDYMLYEKLYGHEKGAHKV